MAPRNENRAAPQLAHQPPGQRRGYRADHPRAARHAIAGLCGGAARNERSMPQKLRAEAQAADSGGATGLAASARLEPFSQREIRRTGTPAARRANAQALASSPAP